MRISDWSSDVCSSDLGDFDRVVAAVQQLVGHRTYGVKMLVGFVQQVEAGRQEAYDDRGPAERDGNHGLRSLELAGLYGACALCAGIALTTSAMAFKQYQYRDNGQHGQCDLRSADRKSTRLNSSH